MVFRLWEKSQSRVNHVIKTVTYSCPGKIDIENMKLNLLAITQNLFDFEIFIKIICVTT